MKTWRTLTDKSTLFDAVQYTKKFLSDNSNEDVRIYVGCDSQNLKRKPWTGYITTIAFHTGIKDGNDFFGTGVHIIYKADKCKKIRDTWTKLWKEVEKSMEIAEELRNSGILIYQVDLDLNQDDTHDSNRLVAAGEGLFRGLGYNVKSKPDALLASRASDHLINKVNWGKVPTFIP